MNDLTIFESEEFGEVRTVTVEGDVWFVGKDIAEALGYERGAKAIADHVDDDDKDVVPIQDSIGRMQNTPIINESGLYSLILSSKLPKAKEFKHWVTSEVLPSVRKHGMYATAELIANPDLAIAAFQALKEEREKNVTLALKVSTQQQQISEMEPKANYYDEVLQNKNAVPITLIAKDYGMSGKKFNSLLSALGIQYKLGNMWLLFQKYAASGYTQSKTYTISGKSVMNTCWTQKGRLFLYDRLKKEGILPVIERKD